jgi:hypothetical protein
MISRRLLLGLGAASLAASGLGAYQIAHGTRRLRQAILYTYGPYEFARSIQALSGQVERSGLVDRERIKSSYPDWTGGAFLNRHIHMSDLSDHTSRSVTAPNNDTLYTSSVLDLALGPVEITVPDSPDRYLSLAFMNMFHDQIAYIGTRATRGKGGTFWIAGPGQAIVAPPNVTLIRSDFNDLWMLGRVFVSGKSDLESARAVQKQISVAPVDPSNSGRPFVTKARSAADSRNYVTLVNEILARSPVAGQSLRASEFDQFGIRPGDAEAYDKLSPWQRALWSIAASQTENRLNEALRLRQAEIKGWLVPPPILGQYGDDDEVRAGVALIGFGALSLDEAIYLRAMTDAQGGRLDGRNPYQVRIPPGGVPTDAFWSLSIYEADETSRLYFYPNEINRYAINSASEAISYQDDGSIVFAVQHEPPQDPSHVWMPVPRGPFEVFFRAYLPRAEIKSGQWQAPPILLRS